MPYYFLLLFNFYIMGTFLKKSLNTVVFWGNYTEFTAPYKSYIQLITDIYYTIYLITTYNTY